VQPLGKKDVDLRVVLLEGNVAGRVPGHVVSGADALVGIQYYLRGRSFGSAVGPFGHGLAPALTLLDRPQVSLEHRQAQMRQSGWPKKDSYDKEDNKGCDHNAKHVEQRAQAPPPLPLRIIKDRFCHCWV